jgi:hypothetical protein
MPGLNTVESSTSHNPLGLHGLLGDSLLALGLFQHQVTAILVHRFNGHGFCTHLQQFGVFSIRFEWESVYRDAGRREVSFYMYSRGERESISTTTTVK